MNTSKANFRTKRDFIEAVNQEMAESLTIEFKEKSDPSSPAIGKEDKKNISKSVSSMANGSGGTLVFGVRTRQKDGIDVVDKLMPISDVRSFKRQFDSVVQSTISPDLKSWKSWSVSHDKAAGNGFLVCEISTSLDRPHMSTAPNEHRYYRRTFQGTIPMTPLEIRDQMLAVRGGDIRLKIVRGTHTVNRVSDWISSKVDVHFILENIGSTMCRNLFLRVSSSPYMFSHNTNYLAERHSWNYGPTDICHIGDLVSTMSVSYHCRILKNDLYRGLANADKESCYDAVRIYDGRDDIHSKTISDKLEIGHIDMNVIFGCEGAVAKKHSLRLANSDLARMAFHSLRSDLLADWGGRGHLPWVEDREIEIFGKDDFGWTFD